MSKIAKSSTTKKKTTNNNAANETTEIVCIIDRSTSIGTNGLVSRTIEGFNSFLNEQKKETGKANLTMCLFDGCMGGFGDPNDTYEIRYDGDEIQSIPELNKATFVPKGSTALYDAIGNTIDTVKSRIKKTTKNKRPDKVVFLIMTDGEENSSKEYNKAKVAEMIKDCQSKDKWAFVFIGAEIDAMEEGSSMGMSSGNILSYTNTDRGVKTVYDNVNASVSMFRSMSVNSVGFNAVSDNLIAENDAEKEEEVNIRRTSDSTLDSN